MLITTFLLSSLPRTKSILHLNVTDYTNTKLRNIDKIHDCLVFSNCLFTTNYDKDWTGCQEKHLIPHFTVN